LPNGNSYTIQWDPAQVQRGPAKFSLLGWRPIYTWTVLYYQAA